MNRQYTVVELHGYTVRDLMSIAGELGIENRHRINRKNDLINAILDKQQSISTHSNAPSCGCGRKMNENAPSYNSHRRSGDYSATASTLGLNGRPSNASSPSPNRRLRY